MAPTPSKSTLPSTVSASQTNEGQTVTKMSYASASQKQQFPKRDQGLVLDCVEGLTLTDYVCAIGKIVGPEKVIYAARISNNRVCLCLSNKSLVDELTTKMEHVKIRDININIRPLLTKQKRIIFSNVAFFIPHYILEEKIDGLGIKRSAPISTLKAGISGEGYEHVLSSRRQTFINPEDVSKLPEFIKIEYEEVSYYVYPSTDVLKCFVCKKEGHIAKVCPLSAQQEQSQASLISANSETNSLLNSREIELPLSLDKLENRESLKVNKQVPSYSTEENKSEKYFEPNAGKNNAESNTNKNQESKVSMTSTQEGKPLMPPPANTKRTLTLSQSTTSSDSQKQRKKKLRKDTELNQTTKISKDEFVNQLTEVKDHINKNLDKYPINYEELAEFLTQSHYKRNVKEIAAKFTENMAALSLMINNIYDIASEGKLKNRMASLKRRLEKNIDESSEHSDAYSVTENEVTEEEEEQQV